MLFRSVPLSDNEQRILAQIEQELRTDERFAQNVSSKAPYRLAARRLWWAGLGVVASLGLTVWSLRVHVAVAFVGFLAMLGCALAIERQLRAMSKVGLADVTASLKAQRAKAEQQMRERFRRE